MGILHVPKLQKNLTRKQGASMTWEFQHDLFGTLAPFVPLLWLLAVPEETKSNLSPKADSALKLSDTAYPGGPPRAPKKKSVTK